MKKIEKSTLAFLSDLKKNNDKEWFDRNRKRYQDAKENFEGFVQDVIDEIVAIEPVMKGLEAKSCIFRINRDIRFSNDKSPYKTNFGAFIVRGGRKNGDRFAGYYLHVEPGDGMLAGGAYIPPAPWLSAIREKVSEEPGKFLKIIHDPQFIKLFGSIQGEKLKSAPRDYDKVHPMIEFLKHKSFLAVNSPSDNKLTDPRFFEYVITVFRAMKPLNDFLNDY